MTKAPIYINGLGNVSPQRTTGSGNFLDEPLSYEANRLTCIDPGYKEFIPTELIRRMGRIIKMGVAASKLCLRDAGNDAPYSEPGSLIPDAIITGTGLGCVEDTEKFLTSMISNNEEFLTPTSFIQSTHNTVAGQIALLLKCHGYNFTFVHRGISFESALLDAMTHFRLGGITNALVGGSDEITPGSFAITSRLGYWKRKPVQTLNLLHDRQKGTIAGEGAAFLFLENQRKEQSYALLSGVSAFLKPADHAEVSGRLIDFLSLNGLTAKDIDLVILGLNGDPRTDGIYHYIAEALFPAAPVAHFKHLCGEYHTASAFATWLGSMALRKQSVPGVAMINSLPLDSPLGHVLIYNHFMENNHAFILLSRP